MSSSSGDSSSSVSFRHHKMVLLLRRSHPKWVIFPYKHKCFPMWHFFHITLTKTIVTPKYFSLQIFIVLSDSLLCHNTISCHCPQTMRTSSLKKVSFIVKIKVLIRLTKVCFIRDRFFHYYLFDLSSILHLMSIGTITSFWSCSFTPKWLTYLMFVSCSLLFLCYSNMENQFMKNNPK